MCYAAPALIYLPQKLEYYLKRISKRAHHTICGQDCQNDCLIDPLEQRMKLALNLFKNAVSMHDHPLHHLIPRNLKFAQKLCTPLCHSSLYQNSFIPFMTRNFNSKKCIYIFFQKFDFYLFVKYTLIIIIIIKKTTIGTQIRRSRQNVGSSKHMLNLC